MKKVLFLLTVFCIFHSIQAQQLVDGERLDNIEIGKSTVYDVISNYGTEYKLKKHSDYSNTLIYEKLGLLFYACQNDPKQEIFTIVMQIPFAVQTSKGIVLGKSTFQDVYRAYGKWYQNSAGFEYEKVGFYFDTDIEILKDFESDNMNFAKAKPSENVSKSVDTIMSLDEPFPTNNSMVSSNSSNSSNNNNFIQNNNISQNYRINDTNLRQNSNSSKNTNSLNSEKGSEDDFKSELKEWGNEIVNRIELIEKGGLRQCHVKFATQR